MTTMTYVGADWLTTNWLTTDWVELNAKAKVFTQQQIEILGRKYVFSQIRISLYNKTNFRVLWEIASDGVVSANYTASSSASADKNVINVKNDILERYWQSVGATSEWIQFDAGNGRTISMDTFALLGTNLTSSAVLTLRGFGGGSDAAPVSWVSVPVYASIPMPADRPREDRVLWIAETLPTSTFRHWRLEIQDPTNPAGFLRIGRVAAGSATVLAGENMLDELSQKRLSFKDEQRLNGFTGISNNRALKKKVTMRFRDLNVLNRNNYQQLAKMMDYARDTLKVLVIPDPQSPYDFSIFAKLTELPEESVQFIEKDLQYVGFELTFDESR